MNARGRQKPEPAREVFLRYGSKYDSGLTDDIRIHASDTLVIITSAAPRKLIKHVVAAMMPEAPAPTAPPLPPLSLFNTVAVAVRHSGAVVGEVGRVASARDYAAVNDWIIGIDRKRVIGINTAVGIVGTKAHIVPLKWEVPTAIKYSNSAILLCDAVHMVGVTFNDDNTEIDSAWVVEHKINADSCVAFAPDYAVFTIGEIVIVYNIICDKLYSLPFENWMPASSSEKQSGVNVMHRGRSVAIQSGCYCGVVIAKPVADQFTAYEMSFAPVNAIAGKTRTILQRHDGKWFESVVLADGRMCEVPAVITTDDDCSGSGLLNVGNTVITLTLDGLLKLYTLV